MNIDELTEQILEITNNSDYGWIELDSNDAERIRVALTKALTIGGVRGSLPSNEELQKVVERISYEQHGEDQAEDCYAKMGILHEFVKSYVDGSNDH